MITLKGSCRSIFNEMSQAPFHNVCDYCPLALHQYFSLRLPDTIRFVSLDGSKFLAWQWYWGVQQIPATLLCFNKLLPRTCHVSITAVLRFTTTQIISGNNRWAAVGNYIQYCPIVLMLWLLSSSTLRGKNLIKSSCLDLGEDKQLKSTKQAKNTVKCQI